MGAMSKESVFELLDYFHSQGGNFIDTSNNYQAEQSEMWIGECKYSPILPLFLIKALSLETCLGNVHSLEVAQSSLLPLKEARLTRNF